MTEAHLDMLGGASALRDLREDWDALAPSPFLTVAWLDAWWDAFGSGERVVAALRRPSGELVSGASLLRTRRGLEATANVHSGDWDVVAADGAARARMWSALAGTGARRLRVEGMVAEAEETAVARGALAAAGFRLAERPRAPSPRMRLPEDPEALLAGVSRNLRSQLGRRRRTLEREGTLFLRVATGEDEAVPALETFLRMEAGGWKGRAGTAIASDPATEALYGAFVPAAARAGLLRMYLLELDGVPIAADIGCAHRGVGYLLKTSFDETRSKSSPGALLRADVLRASVEEGLREYDFLGGAETYKMQWGPTLRPRTELRAYSGLAAALRTQSRYAALRKWHDARRAQDGLPRTTPSEQGRSG
jgi:CelD/BcsL family acetyltransferase involved in cellulose biosynthesis